MELQHTLGKNVRRLRKELSLTQEQLAELSGFHRTYIGSIEQPGKNVTLNVVERLADVFGIEPSHLLVSSEGQTDDIEAVAEKAHKAMKENRDCYALCRWDGDDFEIEPIDVRSEDLTMRILCNLINEGRDDIVGEYKEISEIVERVMAERLYGSASGTVTP